MNRDLGNDDLNSLLPDVQVKIAGEGPLRAVRVRDQSAGTLTHPSASVETLCVSMRDEDASEVAGYGVGCCGVAFFAICTSRSAWGVKADHEKVVPLTYGDGR